MKVCKQVTDQKSMQTSYRSKKYGNKLKLEPVIIEQWDKRKINSKTFAIPISDCCIINHHKTDAVRIRIANVLKLIFCLSHCSMITELQL